MIVLSKLLILLSPTLLYICFVIPIIIKVNEINICLDKYFKMIVLIPIASVSRVLKTKKTGTSTIWYNLGGKNLNYLRGEYLMTFVKQMSLFDIHELLKMESSRRFDLFLSRSMCSRFFSFSSA